MKDNSKHNVILTAINKYIGTYPYLRQISSQDLHTICEICSSNGIVDAIKKLRMYTTSNKLDQSISFPWTSPNEFTKFVMANCQNWYIEEGPRLGLKDAKDIIDFLILNEMCTKGPVTT